MSTLPAPRSLEKVLSLSPASVVTMIGVPDTPKVMLFEPPNEEEALLPRVIGLRIVRSPP